MKKDNEDSSQVEDSLRSEQGLEFEFAATTEDDKFKFFNALKEVDDSHMKDLLANMPDSSDEFSDTMELLRGLQVEKGADSSNINAKEIVDQTDMYLTGHFIDDKGQKSIEEIIEQDYSFSFDSITDISKQNLSSKALETERQPLVSDIESSMDLSSKSIHILPTRRHGPINNDSNTRNPLSDSKKSKPSKALPSNSKILITHLGPDITYQKNTSISETSDSISLSGKKSAISMASEGLKSRTSISKKKLKSEYVSQEDDTKSGSANSLSLSNQKTSLKKSVLDKANAKKAAQKRQLNLNVDQSELFNASKGAIEVLSVQHNLATKEPDLTPALENLHMNTLENAQKSESSDLNVTTAPLLAKIKTLESTVAELEHKDAFWKSELEIKQKELRSKDAEIKLKDEELSVLKQKNAHLRPLDSKDSKPAPHISSSVEMEKLLDEQEHLIRGYQKENEILMAQAKDLRNSIKNLEESHEQRIQNLQKANAALKTQIAGQGISRSPTKDSLVIEDLKSKIIALNREIKLQKDDFGQQVLKYEALLTDCKKNVEQISAGTPAFLHDIKKNLEGENEKHKEYIVELETKLEWHLKGHPIIHVKNDQYQIKGLKSDVIGKERSNQQSLEDVGRIKELEGQLLELQVDSVKSSAPLPDVNESLLSSRSAIENERIALKKECKKDIDLLAEKLKVKNLIKIQNRMKRRILELESQVLAQKSDHANRLTELLHQDEEKTRLLNVSKNSRPDQIAEEELTALKSSLEEALSKNTSLKLQLEVCQKSQSMARESTIELMKSSQQQTTQFAFEHSKQSVEFLKNELRHEQLAYHNKIIETYESQISDLEFRLNQQKNGTDQYDLQNRFDKVQQDYDELFFLHSFCESRIQRASTNIPPSLAELDRLTKRIQELESSSNTREAMLRSRKIDISNYDYDKENMARELRLKESQIRGFQKELNELITSFALIKAFK